MARPPLTPTRPRTKSPTESTEKSASQPPSDSPASLPPVVPLDPRVRRTMRLSLVEGGLVQVLLNWTSGSVLVGYLLSLGAGSTHIALVGSVPFLAQMASPLGAWAAEVLGKRKALTATLAAIGRSCWVLAAFLPELAVPEALRPTLLVLLVFIASAFQAATATVWTAWLGDVVPDERRGRYFGLRTGVLGVIGMVANLGAGAFLDRVAAPLSFQLVLGVAVVSSFLGIALLLLHHDPPSERRSLTLRSVLRDPLRDKNFRRFLGFSIYWQFTVMLGAPFVIPYFLEELSMSFTQVAYWSSIAATTALATTIVWGRVADRVGNKGVLAIGTFLAGAFLPSNWILAGLTGNLGFIWASAAFDALAWGAIGPAIFNLALVSAPRSGRVKFIAMYSLVSGVAGFLGGVLSGPLLIYLSGLDGGRLTAGWSGYHTLFAISGLGRMFAWVWLRRVSEANAWRTRDLLRSMRSAWRGAGLPWR